MVYFPVWMFLALLILGICIVLVAKRKGWRVLGWIFVPVGALPFLVIALQTYR